MSHRLEGINLIEKRTKNIIFWKGSSLRGSDSTRLALSLLRGESFCCFLFFGCLFETRSEREGGREGGSLTQTRDLL